MEGRGATVRIRCEGAGQEGGGDKSPILQEPRWMVGLGLSAENGLLQLSARGKFGF